MMEIWRSRVETAYRKVHAPLWRSLVGYTGDPEVASDAEAEAFVQALRRGPGIRDVEAWVWSSAFRIARGLMKERGRVGLSLHRDPSDVETDPGLVETLDLLGCLSAQQRACVALRYVAGLEPREIAGVLRTTSATVRVQLHRAHHRLRDELTEPTTRGLPNG